MSTGPHFNPAGKTHGAPTDEERHAGDLGNITANEEGVAMVSLATNELSLDGPLSVLDRTIVLHAQPDDLASQPGGNAGTRMACGEITRE